MARKKVNTPRTTTTKPRRPGRPKGAPPLEWATAIEIPAHCPTCNSSDLRAIGGSPQEMATAGEIRGERFDKVVWKNRRCQNCGQYVRVRAYLKKPIQVANSPAPTAVE